MTQGGIRAGTLNRKIEFYKPNISTDNSGQQINTYVLDFFAMAAVNPVRSVERMRHGREEMATLLYRFKIHFTPRLKVTHRVKFNGDFFDVQGFAPMGTMNRRFIEFVGELIDASQIVIG